MTHFFLNDTATTEIYAVSLNDALPICASILLDGKPPQRPPNTFTHVLFGTHQLTATLDDYEPIKQELQVSRGMTPEIRMNPRQNPRLTSLPIPLYSPTPPISFPRNTPL